MKLSTIIEQVRNGDISGISHVPLTDRAIVSHINLALIAMYNRFTLRTEEAIITLETNRTIYKLDGTDAAVTVNGSAVPADDIITITDVYDEFGSIPINNNGDNAGVFTIAYDTIQVPITENGMYLSVVYKAAPNLITFVDDGDNNAVDTDVPLPMSLLEPLLMFIAYRSYLSIGDAGTPDADKYEMKFTSACNKAEELGLVPSDHYSISIEEKGFI